MFVARATKPRSRSDDKRNSATHRGGGATKRLDHPAATFGQTKVMGDLGIARRGRCTETSPRKTHLQTSPYFRDGTLSVLCPQISPRKFQVGSRLKRVAGVGSA